MNQQQGNLTFVLGLLTGAAVGAVAALFFVPQSGPEIREQVVEQGVELKNRADDVVARAQSVAQETVAKIQTTARELINREATGV